MKTCTKCHAPKALDEFVKDKRRGDGRGSWCVLCSREYMRALIKTPKVSASRKALYEANRERILVRNRARWAEKKAQYKVAKDIWAVVHRDEILVDQRRRGVEHRALLDSMKAGHPCLDCGDSFPPYVMEYDHVRGIKRWALGKMSNHRREAVLEEIAKCELICCACHRVRTQARNTHGVHNGKYREWSRGRQAAFHAWMRELKSKPCMDCTRCLSPEAMDFDHVRGEKVQSLSSMWSWGREKILMEIAKCELVCANCHRIRTQQRRAMQEAA